MKYTLHKRLIFLVSVIYSCDIYICFHKHILDYFQFHFPLTWKKLVLVDILLLEHTHITRKDRCQIHILHTSLETICIFIIIKHIKENIEFSFSWKIEQITYFVLYLDSKNILVYSLIFFGELILCNDCECYVYTTSLILYYRNEGTHYFHR